MKSLNGKTAPLLRKEEDLGNRGLGVVVTIELEEKIDRICENIIHNKNTPVTDYLGIESYLTK